MDNFLCYHCGDKVDNPMPNPPHRIPHAHQCEDCKERLDEKEIWDDNWLEKTENDVYAILAEVPGQYFFPYQIATLITKNKRFISSDNVLIALLQLKNERGLVENHGYAWKVRCIFPDTSQFHSS